MALTCIPHVGRIIFCVMRSLHFVCRTALLSAALPLLLAGTAFSQTVVPLWNGPAPHSTGDKPMDVPTLTFFLPDKPAKPSPAIVICPGGGYGGLCMGPEGTNIAGWLKDRGIAGFVLTYRLPKNGYRHPVPLLDAQRALRLVRNRAAEWNIDPTHVGIMGFSAGGHLASTLDTHYDSGNPNAADPVDRLGCRPDFAVLVYPVVTMKDDFTHKGSRNNLLGLNPAPALIENLSNELQVTAQTPPTLFVHAVDDHGVPIENSRQMLAALKKAGVPSDLQEYPTGGHGFGYGRTPDPSPKDWLVHVGEWLNAQGVSVAF